MGKLLKSDLSCPCGKGSTSYAEYEDGAFCFKCGKSFFENGKESDLVSEQYLPWRGINKKTMEFYNVRTTVVGDTPYEIGFDSGRFITLRKINEKTFRTKKIDKPQILFGQDKFPPRSALAVTITEGGVDTLSAYQMLGSKYPVVGIISATSARRECQDQYDYLNSFEKIYIVFDNDEPGIKASEEVASLFDVNKVHVVKLQKKDCNEYLESSQEKAFVTAWWAAKAWQPEGIISTFEEVWEVLEQDDKEPLAKYPFPKLQEMTYGIFPGQLILIKAQEKIGKTEFISHIEDSVIKTSTCNVGIIHIEDSKAQPIKRFATYQLGVPVHLPDSTQNKEEIFEAYKQYVQGVEDRVHLYSHFGSNDPKVFVSMVRYLVTVKGCKIIFLDHVSQIVSGLMEKDERLVHDYLATEFSTLTNDLDFAMVIISHVNDEGQTRSSRYYQKAAHLIIYLDRDKEAEDEKERNTTHVSVEGNRLIGLTGPADVLYFDRTTWRMVPLSDYEQKIPF